MTCQNDIVLTFTTTGGSMTTCYQLTVTTDKHTYQVAVNGQGSVMINHTTGQYTSGTTIHLEIHHDVCRQNGADADAGRRLPGWVRAAGFIEIEPSSSTWTFADA